MHFCSMFLQTLRIVFQNCSTFYAFLYWKMNCQNWDNFLIFFLCKKTLKMEKFVSFVARVRYIEIFFSRRRKIWFVKARVRYIGGSLYGEVLWEFLKGKTRGNRVWFVKSRCSLYRGFVISRVHCILFALNTLNIVIVHHSSHLVRDFSNAFLFHSKYRSADSSNMIFAQVEKIALVRDFSHS